MYNQIPYLIPNLNNATAINKGASFFSKINWANLLSNTQKTLNVVNQAIPLYYQVKPVFNNIKTISKIGKELNKRAKNSNNNIENNVNNEKNNIINKNISNTTFVPNPTFFI